MENQLVERLKEVLKGYKDIPLDFVVEHVRAILKNRTMKAFHVNRNLPNGYEDQGAFNVIIVTSGQNLFDCVIGEQYFRYDVIGVRQIEKFQIIDGMWENKESRKEEAFLSLRLSHGDESHIGLALDDSERPSLKALGDLVLSVRNPEV